MLHTRLIHSPHVPTWISLRRLPRLSDRSAIRRMVKATGMFAAREVDIALELVDDALEKGTHSDYRFLFADRGHRLAGYACFGHIGCTESAFDLHWIVVHPHEQGRGLGRLLLGRTEALVRISGGTRLFIETSGRDEAAATLAFYRRCGYRPVSVIDDFYAPGDPRIIFAKDL